jgi:hypothetical protein
MSAVPYLLEDMGVKPLSQWVSQYASHLDAKKDLVELLHHLGAAARAIPRGLMVMSCPLEHSYTQAYPSNNRVCPNIGP